LLKLKNDITRIFINMIRVFYSRYQRFGIDGFLLKS
jgi:hypothetical protein